jgi:hypothetical protein
MSPAEKALASQLTSIQNRTGKSLPQIYELIRRSGRTRHGEIRDLLKQELNMGHGDANTVAHVFLRLGQ